MYFFFKRWHAWRSFGLNSWLVRESALQMLLSGTSLLIDIETAFSSSDSQRWCCALLNMFLSNWAILSLNKQLQFLVTASSKEGSSYLFNKSSKWLARSDNLEDLFSTIISFSINSSFERFPADFLFQPRFVSLFSLRFDSLATVEEIASLTWGKSLCFVQLLFNLEVAKGLMKRLGPSLPEHWFKFEPATLQFWRNA